MLSPEKGGSSSKNWTRPMGKPKMRKEGLTIWWISEQSPRVFPLIAGRMFSFMKTRLSLSDTDNLSIRIFLLYTGCMGVKGTFLPINFLGWLFYKILDIQKELCFHLLLPTSFLFRRPFPKRSWERKVKAYGFDNAYLLLSSLHRYFKDVM